MRLRKALFVCALVLVMPLMKLDRIAAQEMKKVDAKTVGAGERGADTEALPVPTPLPLVRKDQIYTSAYKDVYQILSHENPCSSFFGGSSQAVEVLNGLFDQLELSRLSSTRVGISMYGQTRSVQSARTGASYRLFEKAVINTSGPFYKKKFSAADPFVPGVGSFQPNTREARATIVLHEIGHLVQGADGRWLLPNDGASDEQSQKNTAMIETRCGEQIRELKRKASETRAGSGLTPEKQFEPKGSPR